MGKPIDYHPARLQRAFRTSIYFPLNRDAKHPLTCAAQLNCVSSRHGKQADSDALQRSVGSQPMGLPIGYGSTHDFALCRSAGAVRQFQRLRHAFSALFGRFARFGQGLKGGQALFTIFCNKHFRFWQKNWHFSEKLQKNHQKIAFFAVWGVDFAKGIAYNTHGTLCKNADFTHKTGQFYNRIMTQQDKQ